jgi:8-oxo-dGTP pyrophosphatase MutT (NUDIX family)
MVVMIDPTGYTRVTDVPVRQTDGGIVIRRHEDQLWVALTIEHEPEFDVIALPKGGVEAGESPVQAAVREIGEETGLQRLHRLQSEPITADQRYGFGKGIWIQCRWFLFAADQVEGQLTGSKHTLMWTPLESLPEVFWPGERDILRHHTAFMARQLGVHTHHREHSHFHVAL